MLARCPPNLRDSFQKQLATCEELGAADAARARDEDAARFEAQVREFKGEQGGFKGEQGGFKGEQ
eukprot:1371610-Pyramimonas_sp.AAC.1